MTIATPGAAAAPPRLERAQIEARLRQCARLPSLRSIEGALRELLHADQRFTSQIAEIIRRDPSLTARLLRLVNSVYYGLTSPVNNIEEAVFYLGLRQIRQLAMVTPVIEDFQKLTTATPFAWREFWQHSIGTAVVTREILGPMATSSDETDYVAGLVHDVGKIVMAAAFREHFDAIYSQAEPWNGDLLERERQVLGMEHGELGALYLQAHNLSSTLVAAARWHHQPAAAGDDAPIVAAVQMADLLVRHARIGNSGNPAEVTEAEWLAAPGWRILFPHKSEAELALFRAQLKRSLERLPKTLAGLV
jgi:HD-like signal output (HDOD) protein